MNIPLQKQYTQRAVTKAINNGIILRLPCARCGNEQSNAHHNDYNKPFKVQFLCHKHHCAWHKRWTAKLPNNKVGLLNAEGLYALGIKQLGLSGVDTCKECDSPFIKRRLPIPYCKRCVNVD